ncbi:reverse transcriptase-like protein [Sphingomonas montana]|uniref:reverse transcriptase-like protein n=1 Tax=Sphingomonas montana TaxID=1843236 RepID=UPI00096C4335|nr:reverse transcriptase-like protein [Sphingomonas montana]
MPEPLKLFFDGGCRPNPGRMSVAVFARGVPYVDLDKGHGDNSDAEWLALIHAMEVARTLGATDLVLLGDSMLVVTQATGKAKCRSPELRAHRARFDELKTHFTRLRIRHTGRTSNLAGIALERALDAEAALAHRAEITG